MQKYLVTSTMTALQWIHPVLNLFFLNVPKIVKHGIHMSSLYGTVSPVVNTIVVIKFGSLPPIQLLLC